MMKKILIFMILLMGLAASSYAFKIEPVDGFQVINKIQGDDVRMELRDRTNFEELKFDIMKTSNKNMYVRCRGSVCTIETRKGKFDFDETERSRNLGNKDSEMFALY